MSAAPVPLRVAAHTGVMGLDLRVLELIAEHRAGWLTSLSLTVAEVGMSNVAYLGALALCLLFGWLFGAWRPAVAAPVAGIVGLVAAEAAKNLIGRPRPPDGLAVLTSGGSSMPSSIAALTAAAALPLILAGLRMANRTGRALSVLVATATLVVGACMIYLGAHWLTDVVAGWALGAAIGAAVFRLIAGPVRRRVPSGG